MILHITAEIATSRIAARNQTPDSKTQFQERWPDSLFRQSMIAVPIRAMTSGRLVILA
jgi:hypothetical protein